VSLNGQKMKGTDLIAVLNVIAGRHGIGILDMVENRVVGMKSRGVYETPAGTVIMEAHAKLEQLCLDRKTLSFKNQSAQRYAELLYEGEWFSPLMDSLNAFMDSTQQVVTGTVKLKLFKGSMIGAGVSSPYSLYDHSLASFATGPLFDHKDSAGFINLLALPTVARGLMKKRMASLEFGSSMVEPQAGSAASPTANVAAPSWTETAVDAMMSTAGTGDTVSGSTGTVGIDLSKASHIDIIAAAKSHQAEALANAS
jgi:hypothetical protein